MNATKLMLSFVALLMAIVLAVNSSAALRAATIGHLTQQSASSQRIEMTSVFEVASIKLSNPDVSSAGACRGLEVSERIGGNISIPQGRCRFVGFTLKQLIMVAYGLRLNQLDEASFDKLRWVGTGPSIWGSFTGARFDIDAKAESPSVVTQIDLLHMLQRLLIDRFKVQLHFEPRLVAGFALLTAKSGGKLIRSMASERLAWSIQYAPDPKEGDFANKVLGQKVTLVDLANLLSGSLRVPVVDQTGLNGQYDMALAWTPADRALGGVSSDFSATLDSLGLRLVGQQVSAQFAILDHAEKPNPN